MNIRLLALTLFLCVAARAELVITADKKFDPPSDWTLNKDFEKEPWWRAFYAIERPEAFTFSEWIKYFARHPLEEANITEARFPELVAEELKKRAEFPPETKIGRIVYASDGPKDYVIVVQRETPNDPRTRGGQKISFFQKETDSWVVGYISGKASLDQILRLLD